MKNFLFIFLWFASMGVSAQELQARLTVNASKVNTTIDKNTWSSLQSGLTNFLNNRKWTSDTYQPQEKIKCNFLLTIDQELGNNTYKASLTIQAARPIYNTSYESPLVNFQDQEVTFKYVMFQPIEFNENRVQGNDPLVSNLTAILAYYVNIILGMDYDSFSPRGGDPYFQKALFIVNNAPENSQIAGWKAFDGLRNRFRLIEGFTDNRYNLVHDAIYNYYRTGMDQFYEKDEAGRTGVLTAINHLNTINTENPNAMVIQFVLLGKSNELVKVFSRAESNAKSQVREILTRLDISNAQAYKELR